ncbi:hypothetical protein JCM8097_005906 [Rhodosporidiobolus ruineniae]
MPVIHHLLLLRDLERCERVVDAATAVIAGLLARLVDASRQRVECLGRMEELRAERSRTLEDEMAAQARSRTLLEDARRECDLQSTWADEIRALYIRAEEEGLDIGMETMEEMDAKDEERKMREKGKGKERDERTMEEREREERAEVYGRQLLYLQHSVRRSESRVRSLLHTLQSSHSSLVSHAALNQITALSRQYAAQLEGLAIERDRLALDLAVKETERARAEEKRDEVVLDLVLDWDEQRRFRARERERSQEEGRGRGWSSVLYELEANELHQQWVHLQASHQAQQETLLGKLVAENSELKEKLERTERELKDVKAGRREDEEALKKATKEIERLTGGSTGLAVAILDFEQDLFAPEVFHHPSPGGYAASILHRKLRRALPTEAGGAPKNWTFMACVFWRRDGEFVKKLISAGLIGSVAELDEFADEEEGQINGFNRAHPLFMFIVTDTPPELAQQRLRALAVTFTRNPVCQRLLLGRWALDLPFAEAVAPMKPLKPGEKVVFPKKLLFAEPYTGFYLPPQLVRREPQIVEMEGVLRRFPLSAVGGGGKGQGKLLDVDYSRPLWKQHPPICLDFYLSPRRCTDERCPSSHSYRISRDALSALRFELSRLPCPLLLGGLECPQEHEEGGCYFGHECPKGEMCDRRGCRFEPPGMHPRVVPAKPPPPYPRPGMAHFAQPVSPPRARPTVDVPLPAAPLAAAPVKPPSTRTALERLLAASSPKAAAAAPPTPANPPPVHPVPGPPGTSPQKLSIPLGSPFDHPLSLADKAEAAAASSHPPQASIDAVTAEASLLHLTDEELRRMLEKARREEREYEEGVREDPFFAAAKEAQAGASAGKGKGRERRDSSLFGIGGGGGRGKGGGGPAVGAAPGDGRAIWEAARSGRGSEGFV